MKRRIHPLVWLAIASIVITLIGVGKQSSPDSQTASTEESSDDRVYTIPELVEMLVWSDGHDDETMTPYYSEALQKIDVYCAEPPQNVTLKAMQFVESQGDDGVQFATLNALEYVVASVEVADSHPVECGQLFE